MELEFRFDSKFGSQIPIWNCFENPTAGDRSLLGDHRDVAVEPATQAYDRPSGTERGISNVFIES